MGLFCPLGWRETSFRYPGNMKTTNPSFTGKKERMRVKYMTKKSVRGKTKGVKRAFKGAILTCSFKAGSRGSAQAPTSAQDFPALPWLSHSS